MLQPYQPGARAKDRIIPLSEAQNWRCCYCGCQVRNADDSKEGWDRPSVEHVRPIGRGGLMAWENEVMSCRLCNTGRARMKAETYLAKVQEIGRWRAFKWATKQRKKLRKSRLAMRPVGQSSIDLEEK